MKLSVILGSLLFTTSILAAPRSRSSRLAERVARRAATRTRGSQPLIPLGSGTKEGPDGEISNVQYSGNWAGAVIESPPAGSTFNAVSAQFNVPSASPPSGASRSGSYSASAWAGIDGDTYGNAILQSGIDFTVSGSGEQSFDAWYEWYPDYAYDFSNFPMSVGDTISVSIVSTSASAGKVTLENLSTGHTASESLTAPSSSSHLGGQNAEWIVEDFEEGSSEVALANFGTVTFTDCVAKTSGGESLGPSSGTIIEIEQNGEVLTDVSDGGSTVTVTYA